MWALSAPGGEAEGCFLRLSQTEYYDHGRPHPDPLMIMPEVSRHFPEINQFGEYSLLTIVPGCLKGGAPARRGVRRIF